MIQIVKPYEIKASPREYLVDCLMAHKKETLLEIANNQSVSVKTSHTKTIIVAELAKRIIHEFDNAYPLLKDDEKNGLWAMTEKDSVKNESIHESTKFNLHSKGYAYFFVKNQHMKSVIPVEIADKLAQQRVQISKETDTSSAEWFVKTREAVESIYAQCSLSHLTETWNQHASIPLTMDEAENFFK